MKIPSDLSVGKTLPTKKWGEIQITDYQSSRQIEVMFLDTATRKITRAEYIRSGSVVDPMKPSVCGVGFLGEGPYDHKLHKREYMIWSSMIERCYSEKYKAKNPTYCHVRCDPIWHNFQEFAEWCQWQKGFKEKGWHLDKDCLSLYESKIYSPPTCVFIPRELNSFETSRTNGGTLPLGVYLSGSTYRVTVEDASRKKVSKRFKSIETALKFYKEVRKGVLTRILEDYSDSLDERLVLTMKMKYSVELGAYNND